MLFGEIKFNDTEQGVVAYKVYAVDNFDVTKLYLINDLDSGQDMYYRAGEVFDQLKNEEGIVENAFEKLKLYEGAISGDTRRLDIKKTNKYKSNIINKDFCLKVSALLRYMQIHGKKNYNQNMGEAVFSSTRYIPVDDKGYIKYSLGTISEIECASKYVYIKLMHTDEKEEIEGVFKELKEKNKYGNFLSETPVENVGFKFCEELLGFKYEEPIKKDIPNVFGMFDNIEDVIANNPDKNTKWILGRRYEIVTDDNLDEVMKSFMSYAGYIAFDTETTGLNINFKSRTGEGAQLVGVVLSKEIGTGYYFPLQHKLFDNLCGGDHWFFMERYMKPLLEGKNIICHNLSYDWKVAYIYDINVNCVYDTMLAFGVTKRYEDSTFEYGLKALAKNILGLDMFDLDDFTMSGSFKDSDITFADLPYELVRRYAPADADMTLSIFEYLEKERILAKYEAHRVFELEITFSKAVAYSEFWGYHLNMNKLPQLKEDINNNMEKYKAEMFKIAGREFNPNSPKQLIQIMYEELGIEVIGNKPKTDKEVLKTLSKQENLDGSPKYPFAIALKKYRDNEGIHKNFLKKLHEFSSEDGYIFPKVMQLGTNTGRCSVNNPNYQSYNDTVKKYVVPRPGFIHIDSDFSQIEYRTLASMAQQTSLMHEFNDADLDYHTYQASRMFNIPYASVSKALRQQSKGVNFGLPYGMGDSSLGLAIFGARTKENTVKAGVLRRKFFEGQEKIEQFFEVTRDGGVKNGYTSTKLGRRRYYHRGQFTVPEIRRQAGNHVIQGCLGGDTRIQTKEYGIVKIKDVVGSHLNVWDGERWSAGDITYSGKKKKCIVKFRGGLSMICSPIHKFQVVSHRGIKRFVECKDLVGTVDSKAAHRVVVNPNYTPSDYEYSSTSVYRFMGNVHNANNIFLDDIQDRFGIGLVLGRLASDGNYNMRDNGGCSATHFIAEHEYNILPKLKGYLQDLGYIEKEQALRVGRSQKITQLKTYSKSLVSEIADLDIKHQVHDNIFMDTEVLRGFLSGLYDGDGGITGKSITLTFGSQYNFEPMCLDLQKALLFFGIRSRYRKYEGDRYVLQIKTNDNKRFLDVVGFLNDKKQAKGQDLVCNTEEKTFGRTLLVESVEILDEYIDMYDVCNTDRGYYVADGVITHNTAADIYKLAVCNLFKRLEREGWLGLVLFNAFVHDEILMEVHESINLYEFLGIWREEFEVKIEGFCRLFAGVGIGYCWYDAKKQDLPPQYAEELINKYHPDMTWDENQAKCLNNIKKGYEEYKIRRVYEYITADENQGHVIKPVIYGLLYEVVGNIVSKLQAESPDELLQLYNRELGLKIPTKGDSGLKDLASNMKVFCKFNNIDYSRLNVISPEVAVVAPTTENNDVDELDEEEFVIEEVAIDHKMVASLRGISIDYENKVVYMKQIPMSYNGLSTEIIVYLNTIVKAFSSKEEYRVALVQEATGGNILSELTHAYLSYHNLNNIVLPTYGEVTRQNLYRGVTC